MVTSGECREGDLVRVTAVGKVVVPVGGEALFVGFEDGSALSLDTPSVTVEVLPLPPVAGRVYRDARGVEGWCAVAGGGPYITWPTGEWRMVDEFPADWLPLIQVWPPLDVETEPDAPDDDFSWPPKRAGLRYRDESGGECESYERPAEIMVTYDRLAEGLPLGHAEWKFGPMTPLGEASC